MKTFTVATYNMCFGLKSNTMWNAYNSTWRVVHGKRDVQLLQQKVNLSSFFIELEKISPDILILNEIFDDLTLVPIREKLNQLGYTCIHVGNSGHHDKPFCVSTLVATKEESKMIPNPLTFAKGIPGSGGGAVAVEVPSLNLVLLGHHLAFKINYLNQQIEELDTFYSNFKDGEKILILAGDFNRTPDFFRKKSMFGKEMEHAITERTFPSFFPWYKPLTFFSDNLVCGAVDNMYYKNAEAINTKVIGLLSDHKMAVVKFKLPPF